jgi:calcium permeable stress-gated cation channel
MFTVTRETIYYINLRQAYMTTPWNSSRISSRTVLFTSVPAKCLDEQQLRQMFDSVQRIWIATDASKAQNLVQKLDSTAKQLEKAEVKLIKDSITKKRGNQKYLWKISNKLLGKGGRPHHRTAVLMGENVDTIEWSRLRIVELKKRTEETQNQSIDYNRFPIGAVFIEFETIAAAQAAYQMSTFQAPLTMTPRCIATLPDAIIWENIDIPAWQNIVRALLATAFIITLTIFWSIPVAFIGALSNINYLAEHFRFLRFINEVPLAVRGALEGLLPSLVLSYAVSLIPTVFRYVAWMAGEISVTQIELKTQEWYFIFQVIQVFMVTTFSSGAAAVVSDIIDNPKTAPEQLAKKLPKASNFYLSYFIIYGFGQSTKNLLNLSNYLFDKFFGYFDYTPREKYERYTNLNGTGWGSWYPKYTNLAVIGTGLFEFDNECG